MKKKILIGILVFVILLLVCAGLFVWKNKSTIEAVVMSQKMSQEEIKEEIISSEKEVDEILEKYLHVLPRELTEEERRKIESGEVSLYEIFGEIYKETEENTNQSETDSGDELTEDKSEENKKQENNSSKTNTSKKSSAEIDSVISQYIGKMYALEAQVSSQASSLISTAKAEYIAAAKTTPKDQRGALKASIISKYMGQALAVESSVDGQVSAIIGELKRFLTENGRSTAVADEMYRTYISKKGAMKAMYLSGS